MDTTHEITDDAPGHGTAAQRTASRARLAHNRSFNIFWAGQTLSTLGDAVAYIALPLLVLQATGSVIQLGLVTAVAGIGQLIAGIYAGVLVDRVDRRRLMILCDSVRMLLYGVIPLGWALAGPQLWLIYVVMLCGAALGTTFEVAYVAAVPNLVDRDQIIDANARLQTTTAVAFVSGPALAGLLSTRINLSAAVGADAVSFAVSAISLCVIRLRQTAAVAPADAAVARDTLASITEAARFLLQQPIFRAILAMLVVFSFLTGAAVNLFIYHLKHDLGQGSGTVGIIFSVASAGGVLAGMLAPLIRRRWGFGAGWLGGFAVAGVASIGIGLTGSGAFIAVLAMVFVLGQTVLFINSQSLRQEVTPDYLLGRVTALLWTIYYAPAPIGAVVMTIVASHIGTPHTLVWLGSAALVLAGAGLLTPARRQRPELHMRPYRAGGDQALDAAGARRRLRARRLGHLTNVVTALVVTAAFVYVAANGVGAAVPPLGSAFNPGTGVWSAAAYTRTPRSQALQLAGLDAAVQVTFDQNGAAAIRARTDHDLFLALGYVHARFRLFQMDLMRRQAEGLLSQVLGAGYVATDRTEDELGLQRTAEAEWAAMSPHSRARQALTAYAQGVNDGIRAVEQAHDLPLLFKLLGYEPAPWRPIDSLAVQGDLVQTLSFNTDPIEYALLVKALGYQRTMQWFPVLPPNAQHPYDPGPYHADAPAPLAGQGSVSADEARAAAQVARQITALPPGLIRHGSDSNNWAVDGTKTASGKALLAGDPHLAQTLPAIWYQVAAEAPDYHFSGVGIPGTPIVLIGHNQHISWTMTSTQSQATLFYAEKTDPAHPDQYYWNGAWRRMKKLPYTIPVKGGQPVHLTVYLTVHGPLLLGGSTEQALPTERISVDWMGALPSSNVEALLGIVQAPDFAAFRAALRVWHAPTLTFAYADDKGNIGLIAPGYYPIVKSGAPYLPLPGTGAADVVGTIPFADVPQVYDPPSHFVFSANQRPVDATYPYYIGTSLDQYDNGYRADRIYGVLAAGHKLTAQDMERLQQDTHDYLAQLIVPRLLAALRGTELTAREREARSLLRSWDDAMDTASPAASIWWTFWTQYMEDTFQPWWDAYHVPVDTFSWLAVGPAQTSLVEDLEQWTLHDPANVAFSPPHGAHMTAAEVMRKAFKETVAALTQQLGAVPSRWTWGRLHTREFDSLTQIASLTYGPRPGNGDPWTVDAADGGLASNFGPSWRFVMDWGSRSAVGVYPGGQSEDPLSPWYTNQVAAWWDGRYYPMPDANALRAQAGHAAWDLSP